ncbi:MAG: tetraprenyl-beta-curcumene synthase family protein [Candidatus Eremiobacteraeota bacterium]|nr:tetraprenyl-beta-curcumene synthase family protein [Candidatus Eremiobacteraeota bacterium]
MLEDEIRFAVRHVLGSGVRMRALTALHPRGCLDFARFLRTVVPLANKALMEIRAQAERIPDPLLRNEAIASVRDKAYHVAGASILATFLPAGAREHYVRIVAPLESIYDYLDNLCDRHPNVRVGAYPVLHRALADALDPSSTPGNYYASGPDGDDGGYLSWLALNVRAGLMQLAGYERLLPRFREAAALYADLQTYKHLPEIERNAACIAWFDSHKGRFPNLSWWEFASAAGSQFQVYGPLYEAFLGNFDGINSAYDAYFPNVSALHVLLDYFIDQDEDLLHDELNFVACYVSPDAFRARAAALATSAAADIDKLSSHRAHAFVLRVMALFYLTHPKVYEQGLDTEAQALLQAIAF